MDTFLLSTAIPFVNAAPHLGHALEFVHADVLARHARRRGRPVSFLTGTDEHAVKNVHAAAAAGVPVATFVAGNAERFRVLADALDISYDDFIRTSADPRHRPVVEAIWARCAANGDLYRAEYEALYCAGCEEFRDACDEHDAPLELVREENWFFRLHKYAPVVRELVESGRLRIEPRERRNEVRGLLASDVPDLSVSRPRARVGDWGIPVPGDPGQVVYVWFDALVNYVSAPGFERWVTAARRTHVIGKGILRFHALIWPAILLAAGIALPDELFVHDYVRAGGRKISKSLGNVVDPNAIVATYGVDAVRWWFAREIPRVGETDFAEAALVAVANRDLANGLGNLVQRVTKLAAGVPVATSRSFVDELPSRVDDALASYDVRRAAAAVADAVVEVNRHLERHEPWKLTGTARTACVAEVVAATRVVAAEFSPFVPALAAAAGARLATLVPGEPLVPRRELRADAQGPGREARALKAFDRLD
jgi:methionyl-tRNA synthetase